MKVLLIVDMQYDFITGPLGSSRAEAIVPAIVDKIKEFDGMVLATKDTHSEDYLQTEEGKNLPVPHCIKGTQGWRIHREIERLLVSAPIEKNTFGSTTLGYLLSSYDKLSPITEIVIAGVCTDICVISNALLLKAFLPETKIFVDASLCAGSTEQQHQAALETMRSCQIKVLNE